MPAAAIVEEVTQSGLRGRGGAGFPTGIKWRTVADTAAEQKYIVCNADEGDSGTFADRMIMEGDPFVLIEGMTIAGIAVGATKGYVYVRSEYPHAIAVLNDAIAAARSARHARRARRGLGATPSILRCGSAPAPMCAARRPRCSTASKASAAWCAPSRRCRRTRACSASRPSSTTCCRSPRCRSSWRRARRSIETSAWAGRAAPCRSSSPATSNIRGLLRDRVRHHARRTGRRHRRRHRERAAGARRAGRRPARRLFPARAVRHAVRLRGLRRRDGLIGHGGIVVFDDTVDMAKQARFAMEFCAIESCGKCTPCRIGSTRGVEIIDRIIAQRRPRRRTSRCSKTSATP